VLLGLDAAHCDAQSTGATPAENVATAKLADVLGFDISSVALDRVNVLRGNDDGGSSSNSEESLEHRGLLRGSGV